MSEDGRRRFVGQAFGADWAHMEAGNSRYPSGERNLNVEWLQRNKVIGNHHYLQSNPESGPGSPADDSFKSMGW